MSKFFITTAIYYVNAPPHVGSACEPIAADALARYHRMLGEDVLFSTGTDENALKVVAAARQAGTDPLPFVDRIAEGFRQTWRDLAVGDDRFIRTTEPEHHAAVQRLIEELHRQGNLYPGVYEGWYCLSDETYFRENELVEGRCPNPHCGRPVEWVREEGYFFRLSAFQDRLLAHLAEHPEMVQPDFRRNEVVSFIEGGLKDVWVTRQAEWGIPLPESVPHQPGTVVYVWFDALVNYLTVAGYGTDPEKFGRFWPPDVQLIGKDILVRFHASLWPAMLMAAGLESPRRVFAHGFWNLGGEKISKSRGALIHPVALADELAGQAGCSRELAVDALRYFLLREAPFGQDGDFSMEALQGRFNSDLANDLGNLLARTETMIQRYCGGKVPAPAAPTAELEEAWLAARSQAEEGFQQIDFSVSLRGIWGLISALNRHVEEREPWALAKQGKRPQLEQTLYRLAEGIRLAAAMLFPVMPRAAEAIACRIGCPVPVADWRWANEASWGRLGEGARVSPGPPLFPRIEARAPVGASSPRRLSPAEGRRRGAPPTTAKEEQVSETISFADFKKLDLRIGRILAADLVAGADKLIRLTVDLGELGARNLVAGIALTYPPEKLVGRQVVVAANLEPATIRGIRSEGMILACGDERSVNLLTPDREAEPGERVG